MDTLLHAHAVNDDDEMNLVPWGSGPAFEGTRLVSLFPFVRAGEDIFRQDVEAAGYRACTLKTDGTNSHETYCPEITDYHSPAAAAAELPEPGLIGGMMPMGHNRIALLTGYIAPGERFVTWSAEGSSHV